MAKPLTEAEKRQVLDRLESANQANRIRALESKHGFFAWLKNVGLGAIVVKLAEMVWSAIKSFFGFS